MLSSEQVLQTIRPLRLIFWGGLLCVVDLSFSEDRGGQGFRFDLLNDTVGVVLIVIGLSVLRRMPVGGHYPRLMSFAWAVAIASIFSTALKHFIFFYPPGLGEAMTVLDLAQMGAILAFCVAMRLLALEAALPRSARSWRLTTILFGCLLVLPLGAFYVVGLLAVATGRSFNIDLGPAGLLLLPVFIAPLIHLFVSVRRMQQEAGGWIPPDDRPGFPVVGVADGPRRVEPIVDSQSPASAPSRMSESAPALPWRWFGLAVLIFIAMGIASSLKHEWAVWDELEGTGSSTSILREESIAIHRGLGRYLEPRVVAIQHLRRPPEPVPTSTVSRTWGGSGPGLPSGPQLATRSRLEIISPYPQRRNASGLLVDGVLRRAERGQLLVVYTSDVHPATEIEIAEHEREFFLYDLRNQPGRTFLERWILPRLP